DVVGSRLLDEVPAGPERGTFDAAAAAVGEDVVADAGHVTAPEILPERVAVVLLHGHDPHVDPGIAHRERQNLLELVEAHLALHLPPPPGLLPFGGGDSDGACRQHDDGANPSDDGDRGRNPAYHQRILAAEAWLSGRRAGATRRERGYDTRVAVMS